jgi:bifunctional non-homologous end joining protein LigD
MEVSNADRVVFPDDGITKGQVVAYYESVAKKMLPFLANRALTVERFPRGTGSKGFANLGVITFHVPPSTVDDDWHPDWVIWDLDPPSGAFGLVREAALAMREVLAGFGIKTVLMTSGSNGYHLRARLDSVADAEAVAKVARGTSALASAAYPDQMTLAFRKADRGDRVFVDWLRNAPYSTSVVPWSIRARVGAPVAVPISWDEIEDIDPNGIHMAEAGDRFGLDPWKGLRAKNLTPVVKKVEDALADAGIELEPFDRFRS